MKQINLLKRMMVLLVTALTFTTSGYALVGTYTVGGVTPNYTTLKDAINAVNAAGVTGEVIFKIRTGTYSGSNWQGVLESITGASASARVIFESESGNPADVVINVAGTSTDNYIVKFDKASFITFRNLSFENTNTSNGRIFHFMSSSSNDSVVNCRFKGATTTSSSDALAVIYAYQHTGSDNVFYKNVITNGGTSIYWRGTSTANWSKNPVFAENTINMTNSGYYGFYIYTCENPVLSKNIVNYSGSSTFYGVYTYQSEHDLVYTENEININSTSIVYPMYLQYINYYSGTSGNNGHIPIVKGNKINAKTTSGTIYPYYNYYCWGMEYTDNEVNIDATSGSIYPYSYYNRDFLLKDNEFNFTATTGSLSGSYFMNYNSGNYVFLCTKNVFNLKATSGSMAPYWVNYGTTAVEDNEINITTTTGTIQNYFTYPGGAVFANNKIKCSSTTGTIQGLYMYYGSTSYPGIKVYNNDIEMVSSGAAPHSGLYFYSGTNANKVYNNIITSSTQGACSLVYVYNSSHNTGNRVYNNVFHSLQSSLTSTTNYGVYSVSTAGEFNFHSNIVSRSTPLTSGGFGVYITGSAFKSDYNLYDLPGATMFYHTSYNGASLNSFREKAGVDMNSLVYTAPYTNAAARDFTIDAASPAAWAVNGRGMHDTTRYTDLAGTAVPRLVTDGVPDIGAYDVTPTSTPPDADATPANPVANAFQVFTFGQDTVLAIEWGATVPATYTVKQYTGIKATPVPAGLKRMFFNIQGDASSLNHSYTAYTFYKDPWIGDIPTENDAVLARQSGTGGWVGYNYSNAVRETTRNIVSTVGTIDSAGSFTVVENGRIGIRCVYPPTGIRISNITAESADIKWDAIYNPLGYQVIVKKTSTPPTDTEWGAALNPTSNSVTSGNLNEDTKYYVFVRNICGEKDTSGYTIDSFTTIITCHAPTITVVDVHNTRAVVYWDSVRTAYGYEVALTTTSTAPENGTNITNTERLFSFLDPGKTYYAHVRANCNTMYAKSEWTTVEFSTWATGVEQINNTGAGIEIYPNPVRDELVVTLGGKVISGTVTVQDMTGKTLKAVQATENKVHVNVNELPAGVYILQYAEDGRREQVKFTKQ